MLKLAFNLDMIFVIFPLRKLDGEGPHDPIIVELPPCDCGHTGNDQEVVSENGDGNQATETTLPDLSSYPSTTSNGDGSSTAATTSANSYVIHTYTIMLNMT